MTRNIGGSVLPSSDRSVFEIKIGQHGAFQVRELTDQDTHAVYFARSPDDFGKNEIMVASHPNGFKCDSFAKRTLLAWERDATEPALSQFDYILACGGKGVERDVIEDIVNGDIERAFEPRSGFHI